MPLSIDSLNVPGLRVLASDLGIVDAGDDKASLIETLKEVFAIRGLDPLDVGSASRSSQAPAPKFVAQPIALNPPAQFEISEDDRARRFTLWLDEFECYLDAVGESDTPRTKSIFLYCAGPGLQRLVEAHKHEKSTYVALKKIILDKFSSSSSVPFNRFKLSQMMQHHGESIDDFASRLRSQARFCDFSCSSCNSSQDDEQLFDVVLRNSCIQNLRTRIFERGHTKLGELLETARNLEIAVKQAKFMERKMPESNLIAASSTKQRFKSKKPAKNGSGHSTHDIRCKFCDQRHAWDRSKCPANGKRCSKCGGLNHFSACCGSSKRAEPTPSSSHCVSSVVAPEECVFSVDYRQAFVNLQIHGSAHKFLIDSGATQNLIPKDFIAHKYKLDPCPSVRCYSGSVIQPIGRTELRVGLPNGEEVLLSFLVVKKGLPLLCLRDCQKLGFLSLGEHVCDVTSLSHENSRISDLLKQYSSLFDASMGCVTGIKAHIQIKEEANPRFVRSRPVPLALREKVDAALESMINRGTLKPVKTSKWASPIVIVPKPDGQVRLCADYTTTVAKVVDTESYPLPRPEELLSSLSGNAVFSKLDLRTCFEQFMIDEESKQFLTINTSRGLLQYNRLPYGISSAPAIVQRAMEDLLRGLNVQIYLDDILVASPNISVHLKTLTELFGRLTSANLRLRRDKCEFAKSEIKYLGFVISRAGISPDADKVRAIENFPAPSSLHELRSFLGLVRFYDKFIDSLADIAKPLYELLKKETKWMWQTEQHNAFLKIKSSLTSPPCLHHYDPSMQIVLSTDASPVGVSAVLSHRDNRGHEFPIAYASRSLSACETRYAQIDREALAIVYGVKKFTNYLLGRKFTLVTDHQPLTSIFGHKKGLPSLTTARLHRYSLFLLSYDFVIEYRSSEKNSNADALSRAPVDPPFEIMDETEEYLTACLTTATFEASAIASETIKDSVLSEVLQNVNNGWPKSPEDRLRRYWKHRNELSVQSGVLFRGHRVVIPSSMQQSILQELHSSHFGIVKMKASARQYVWWPSLDDDVESCVKMCPTCQLHAVSPPAQSIKPWPAAAVWERVHLDYAEYNGKRFLVLFDSGSKWIEAKAMASTTSYSTLRVLYDWFTRFGFPHHIHCDGGPQFTSQEFRSKLKEWGVKLTISPPYAPICNGAAERAVRILKEGMRKSLPIDQLLFCYRATPTESGVTPAELMFGRPIRTRLSAVFPSGKSQAEVKNKFQVGDSLWIRDFHSKSRKWQKARCIETRGRAVLKFVLEDGSTGTRHINHVRRRT